MAFQRTGDRNLRPECWRSRKYRRANRKKTEAFIWKSLPGFPEPALNESSRRGLSFRSADIQINQDISRLGAFVWANNPAVFQLIHDSRSARVTESQTALQKRHACFLFAADHFDALLD